MTPEQLDEIEKLRLAATGGKWQHQRWPCQIWEGEGTEAEMCAAIGPIYAKAEHPNREQVYVDAKFMEAMSEHALPLVKALREARAEVERRTDWYQQRFNALRTWVEDDVAPLSLAVAKRYWNIVANGSPSPHESADWAGTMHAANLRADIAEGRLRAEIAAHAETKAEVERLREAARQVHALAEKTMLDAWCVGIGRETLRDIYNMTKGLVE